MSENERFTPEGAEDFVAPDETLENPEAVEAKEQTPLERLDTNLDSSVQRLLEKGLESDAAEMVAVKAQVRQYAEQLKADRAALEEKLGRRLSASDYFVEKGMFAESFRRGIDRGKGYTEPQIPIFSSRERTVRKRKGLKYGEPEEESFRSFSKQGEEGLYKALGALEEDQRVIDIPQIIREQHAAGNASSDLWSDKRLSYTGRFDMGGGVQLAVHKNEFYPSYADRWKGLKIDRVRDESANFLFKRDFVASILGEEKK